MVDREKLQRVFEKVADELARIEAKFQGREVDKWFDHTDRKFRILAEEVGEIAMALNDHDEDNLPVEIIQVMAVAASWMMSDHDG